MQIGVFAAVLSAVFFLNLFGAIPDSTSGKDTLSINSSALTNDSTNMQDSLPPIEKMPELKTFIKADYPPDLVKKGIEGKVLMDLVVNEKGTVDSISLVKGLNPVLDSNAIKAAFRFVFAPAIAGGKPVAVVLEYAYNFTIDEIVKEIEQYVNFKGRLLQRGTRNPISNANVVIKFSDSANDSSLKVPFGSYLKKIGTFEGQLLEEGSIITESDSLGYFSFKSLPACSITVKVITPDCDAFEDREIIKKGEVTNVTYRLQPADFSNYEITVYGKVEKKDVSKQSLSMNEVQKVPGVGGDALKVIQTMPGVARSSFMSGNIILRGSSNNDTRYFLDGVSIPYIYHLMQLKSVYNSDALSSVDLYQGGFGTQYGNSVGGVVEIKGREAKNDRWHGVFDMNFLDASAMAEGPITPKLSLLTTVRRSYFANLLTAVINRTSINLPVTVAPYYFDWLTRLDYKVNPDVSLFMTLLASKDEVKLVSSKVRGGSDQVSDDANSLSQEMNFQLLLLGSDIKIGKNAKNMLRLSLGRNEVSSNIYSLSSNSRKDYQLYLRDETEWSVLPKLNIKAGLDFSPDSIQYEVRSTTTDGPVGSDYKKLYGDLGAYGNIEYKPVDFLTLTPGIRYDYYPEIKDGAISPRINFRYDFMKDQAFKGSWGLYSETPQPIPRVIDSVYGNPNLPLVKGSQTVIGYESKIKDLLNLDVQCYYNTQSNIPEQYDSISSQTGKQLNILPIGNGRMYGLEIMLKHDQDKRFFGWISYSLSRSERRYSLPPHWVNRTDSTVWDPNKWYLYNMDQTHNIQIAGSVKLKRNWEAGLRLQFVTGNPVTPLLGYTENKFSFDAENGKYQSLNGGYLSGRMGPFFQVDLRVSKTFIFSTWTLSSYLEVQNVNYFIYNSPQMYSYSYDDFERQIVGGIIIPSIGLRAEF